MKPTKTERRDFEMTQTDLDTLLSAMKPVPYMIAGGMEPRSQQENANDAWARLGAKMGFDHMTALANGRGDRCFSAVPVDSALHIVFTDFPGPSNECVFVEVETSNGKSINVGEWRKRVDGLVELVIPQVQS